MSRRPTRRSMFVARSANSMHCDSMTMLCHALSRRKALKNREAAIVITLAKASLSEKVIGATFFFVWKKYCMMAKSDTGVAMAKSTATKISRSVQSSAEQVSEHTAQVLL